MISQDTCSFYDDHVVYTDFKGVVLAEEEGANIAAALGSKKAAILQNHGLLVATSSVEATVFFFASLEKSCQVQLLADAACGGASGLLQRNKTCKVSEEDCKETYRTVGSMRAGWFSGLPQFHVLEAQEGVRFKYVEEEVKQK